MSDHTKLITTIVLDLSTLSHWDFENLKKKVAEEEARRNPPSLDLTPEEKALVRSNLMIPAIKALRARTGSGLKDSKDVCDNYRRTLPGWFEGAVFDEVTCTWVNKIRW